MKEYKPTDVPIGMGLMLSIEQCPKTREEIEFMSHLLYANVVITLMYAMVCI